MSYLADYMHYTSANYCPDDYHEWCALGLVACACSRQTSLTLGRFTFYPNIYIILVGEAGCGKDTALDEAKTIIEELELIPLSAERQSKEDLVGHMVDSAIELPGAIPADYQTRFLIMATEMEQFLAIDPAGMIGFLTAVYDKRGDFPVRTLTHGSQVIPKPYLNLMMGAQPSLINTYLTSNVLSQGFARRANFILPTRLRPRKAFYSVDESFWQARERVKSWLIHLREKAIGSFTLTPNALAWYVHWFENRKISGNPACAQYDTSLHTIVLRLSMLLSLCESTSLIIDIEHLKRAETLCTRVRDSLPRVLGSVGRNPLASISDKVEQLLIAHGGKLPLKELQAMLWSDAQNADQITVLNHLTMIGRITTNTVERINGVDRQMVVLVPKTIIP